MICRSSLVIAATVFGLGGVSQADTTIDFDDFAGRTPITDQYAGALFTNAITLESPAYNFTGFPPHSGLVVVYSGTENFIRVDSTEGTWADVSIWYSTASDFGVYLEAYDSSDQLLAFSYGPYNYMSSDRLRVSVSGIAYVVIHDSVNGFTIDDFTFRSSFAVPEPASLAMSGFSAAVMGRLLWRRRRVGRRAEP